MIDPATLRRIGVFGKPTGYKGDIVLLSDGIADVGADMFVFVSEDGLPVPWHLTAVRAKGEDYVVHIKDIDSDTAAAAFTGAEALAEKSYIEANSEDADESELLYADLIGYRLLDDGEKLGTVTDVDDSTENVVFEVECPDGKNILVPAADDFIEEIDTTEKIIRMSLPAGLTDLN